MADLVPNNEETTNAEYLDDAIKKRNLLQYFNSCFEKCAQQRQNYENQWYMNMAFYFGRQWVVWVGTNIGYPRLVEPPAPDWRVRLTINRTKTYIRNEVTKLTKEEPQCFVMPNTSEESDLSAARAAESIFEYLMFETLFNAKRRSATLWCSLCGTSFFKTHYDPTQKDSSGKPGKMMVDPVSPFHLWAPILQEEFLENQPYLIHAMAKEPEWVKSTFGVEVQPDVEVAGGAFEQKLLNALGINQAQSGHKLVNVKEIWIKPCPKYPEGLVAWFTKDTLLGVHEGWPYDHGRYPFQKITHIPTTKFYGDSIIVDLIPLQKEYNRSRSQIIESKNRMAKPQLLVAQGSVDPSKITSEPGQIIPYKLGFPAPIPLPLQNLPPYVLQEMETTLRDMDDIAGQYEVTKGRTPPGVEAASAIAYLQEENDTRLHHTITSIEEAVQSIGNQLLSLVVQFWDEARLVKVVGKTGMQEAQEFMGSDVKGNTDLRVEAGSMAPRSRAARQAFITELMNNGHITQEMGLKYLQMSETNALYEELLTDRRQIQRENIRMSRPLEPNIDPMTQVATPYTDENLPVPQINPFDNDDFHILYHEQYMKSQEFELLPEDNKKIHLIHWAKHKERKLQGEMDAAGTPMDTPGNQPPADASMNGAAPNEGQLALA